MKKLLLIAVLGWSGLLFSQTVCTSTLEQCRAAQKRLCAKEKAPPNFDLGGAETVVGSVEDQSGAKFEGTIAVQMRSPGTGRVLRTAKVADGKFDLGVVKPGWYRLIVVKLESANPERLRPFDQPRSVSCDVAGSICRLVVTPIVHGTDNPIDSCPPK